MPVELSEKRFSEENLAEQWFGFMHGLHGQLVRAFRAAQSRGIDQKEIGRRLRMDPAQVSRYLRGRQNMTVRTIHNLARAMDCRLNVTLESLYDVTPVNRPNHQDWSKEEGGNMAITPNAKSWDEIILNAS